METLFWRQESQDRGGEHESVCRSTGTYLCREIKFVDEWLARREQPLKFRKHSA